MLVKYYLFDFIDIGNLTQEVDEDSLRAAFIPFGEIKSIDIPIDPATGKAKTNITLQICQKDLRIQSLRMQKIVNMRYLI